MKLIQIAHGRALCFDPTFTPEREEMEQLVTEMTLHNFCSGIELDLFDKGIVKVYFNPFVHDNSKMDYVTRQLIKLIKRATCSTAKNCRIRPNLLPSFLCRLLTTTTPSPSARDFLW